MYSLVEREATYERSGGRNATMMEKKNTSDKKNTPEVKYIVNIYITELFLQTAEPTVVPKSISGV